MGDSRFMGDDVVLTNCETLKLLGISRPTLNRLDRAVEGPPRIQLSSRRALVGGSVTVRAWLRSRQRQESAE
jgi:predicted DNA-binding transcriptional regulator AlpA